MTNTTQQPGQSGLQMRYFVLKPSGLGEYSYASRKALMAYADSIQSVNPALAEDLQVWVRRCEVAAAQQIICGYAVDSTAPQCTCTHELPDTKTLDFTTKLIFGTVVLSCIAFIAWLWGMPI